MTVDDFLKEWHSEEPFVVAHTSGSTGKPKEIKLLKADMRASAALTNRFFSIDSGSTLLLCLSPDYIAGKMMIVRAEEAGATLLVESPSNRPLEHFSDLLAVVPSQALWLAEHQESLNNVRNMIVGGGEITPRLRTMLSQLHVNAYATYGMTETCSHVALSRIAEPAQPFEASARHVRNRPSWMSCNQRSTIQFQPPTDQRHCRPSRSRPLLLARSLRQRGQHWRYQGVS